MARVLVVEDEPRMRSLLEEVLGAEGHEAVAAVIDVMHPGMDGSELCRHLRRGGAALEETICGALRPISRVTTQLLELSQLESDASDRIGSASASRSAPWSPRRRPV
jgi:CheY-like chemotaxis protein